MFSDSQKNLKFSIIVGSILAGVTLFFYLPSYEKEHNTRNVEHLYQTWELADAYRNGQKVVDERNRGLQITIHPDSTATETVRGLSYQTIFYVDSKLEYVYTGQEGKPEKYKIYTLTKNILKYGQTECCPLYFYLKGD